MHLRKITTLFLQARTFETCCIFKQTLWVPDTQILLYHTAHRNKCNIQIYITHWFQLLLTRHYFGSDHYHKETRFDRY